MKLETSWTRELGYVPAKFPLTVTAGRTVVDATGKDLFYLSPCRDGLIPTAADRLVHAVVELLNAAERAHEELP